MLRVHYPRQQDKQTNMNCDMSYCQREAIYTSKTGSKYCVDHQIAFNCDCCHKPIVRDSEQHDNCNCDDEGEKWYCEDCYLHGECNNCGIEANDLGKCGQCELIYCLQCQMEGLCDCCYEILKEEEDDEEDHA